MTATLSQLLTATAAYPGLSSGWLCSTFFAVRTFRGTSPLLSSWEALWLPELSHASGEMAAEVYAARLLHKER